MLVAVTGWALATRDGGAPVTEVDGPIFWVATDGDDAAPGTQDEPWATLQQAADPCRRAPSCTFAAARTRSASTVHVSGEPGAGRSPSRRRRARPSSSTARRWRSPAGQSAMIEIDSQRYVTIRGFEITGYASGESGHVPIGIFVTGAADHVRLSRNFVHDMGTTFAGRNGGDAHGIGVFGTTADHPIEEVDDRRQRAREPHARLVGGTGRERERRGLPDRGEPRARHEQHRDRRDRVRGDGARPHRRSGARRDRPGQHRVEHRQLRQPRLRRQPQRRRDLRRRWPRRGGRGQRDPRREHRDRDRERARRPVDAQRHGPQQPRLRRHRDRRSRSAATTAAAAAPRTA